MLRSVGIMDENSARPGESSPVLTRSNVAFWSCCCWYVRFVISSKSFSWPCFEGTVKLCGVYIRDSSLGSSIGELGLFDSLLGIVSFLAQFQIDSFVFSCC